MPKEKEPEPKPKEPEPKPKEKEPEPKPSTDVKPVAYTEVKQLFQSYCVECHGAPGKKPGKGVDVRTVAAILKGGDDGPVVKPGVPDKSSLYLTMLSDGDDRMPPAGKKKPSPAELKLIHDWIASGAKPRRTVRRRR
jgi:mono/diheme cytochrome c family protein